MAEPLLTMSGISKAYGPVRVLENVDLSLSAGEVRCLAGENGSGKSTLIKILSGVVAADGGTVTIAGRRLGNDARAAIDAGLSVIYQDFSLFPNLTVAENIAFLRFVAQGRRWNNIAEQRRLAGDVLARMSVDIDPRVLVETLPVASKQLIAIARALANDARIIVMDEPTTALTRNEVTRLAGIVAALKDDGVAFLFVSHKTEEVFSFCDTITVLRDGHVVAAGAVGDFDADRLGREMTGRSIAHERIARADAPPQPVFLQTRGLTRRGDYADISLELRPGEIVSILGLLGSGRTELAQTLFGMVAADSGEIRIAGEPVAFAHSSEAVEAGIGYVPEDRLTEGLFLDQPIGDNITVASLEQSASGGLLDRRSLAERARRAVERLRIRTPGIEPPVATLSGGNQQRVVLARWMERSPALMILNGPTVGVDIGSKREIHELLVGLNRSGTALLVVTDDIGEALALSDRILVMVNGRITAAFDPRTADEDTLYAAVTTGGDR
ncbi:sugar ABC transporter ATP-binding protein [Aurantimonas sp. MSK8Z-1]|uniref:sugar ABC transporter ATP-binding protein n=1 Tax=Mangrovibrevibacter kandeliae TaxID=2968473 RepID=UPI00211988CE|nr:sugar ABC transporter ATP-binding protein [Aurantimonas sp. MSK8Z-1]MCW4115707.1 sugar ABC transporter ATP-binding protein [Aurantimonas sp. MSK8Z-1]